VAITAGQASRYHSSMETITTSTRASFAGLALCVWLLLAACAPTTEGRAPWFGTATIGTATNQAGQTFGTNIIVHLGYTGDIGTLDVTVTGPDGFRRTETIASRTPRLFLQELHSRAGGPLVSGTYVVAVAGSGGEQTWTLDFDATATVAAPVVAVVSATTTSVEVAWDLVPGARTYEVTLFERTGANTGQSVRPTVELVDPAAGRHTFGGLDLRPDGEYWVSLFVYDGLDRNDPNAAPRQINSASHTTAGFTPTASN
jgi:hypothetical protein